MSTGRDGNEKAACSVGSVFERAPGRMRRLCGEWGRVHSVYMGLLVRDWDKEMPGD